MRNEENTNWGQSVAGIILKENKVLLVRHTYGSGKGMLIIPGGYVKWNETPQDAVTRDDVPDLTKKLLLGVINSKNNAFKNISYEGNTKNGAYSLYGLE